VPLGGLADWLGGRFAPPPVRADPPPPPPISLPRPLAPEVDLPRDRDGQLPSVYVLSPQELGLTTREMPSLFWYLSRPTDVPVKITLRGEDEAEPPLEFSPPKTARAGIYRLDLAERKYRLTPGIEYRWAIFVAAGDPQMPGEVVAKGTIKRLRLTDALSASLSKAARPQHPTIYAEAGIWYDAFAAVSDLIEASPEDRRLRRVRAQLLSQVHLPEPAAAEFKAAGIRPNEATTAPVSSGPP
jgi:hypothetical protein